MAFFTLNTSSPSNDTFTLVERTLVQTSILGGARPTGQSRVELEISTGSEWRYYGIPLDNNEPEDWNLPPGQYRPVLTEPSDTPNDVIIAISVVAD